MEIPATADTAERHDAHRSRLRDHPATIGVRQMLVTSLGIAPLGLVVGAAVSSAGIDRLVGWSSSWTVYGASGQLLTVDLLHRGAPLAILAASIAILNLRLVAYAADLSPHWRGEPRGRTAFAAMFLVDPTYALTARFAEGGRRSEEVRRFYLGAGITLWVSWLLACAAGLVVGDLVAAAVPPSLVLELSLIVLLAPRLRVPTMRLAMLVAAGGSTVASGLPLGLGPLLAAAAGTAVALGVARNGSRLGRRGSVEVSR